ncbi:Canalicular multispecific organic anion transporter 2 [Fusarium albosuccineum]|uniref:Canalicular multispecific organic anion transporter 2 n=1 Tax=Fusarium albosuccineum TaxID=1237068 RepID=A0A8H4PDH1_9HYPO|nr:Canalicular multispecific organic anion transporter 2 [Fusarium albosuccineum]
MADDQFGPHHPGIFDFTLLFEQSILSILPTSIFLILVPFRIAVLWHHGKATRSKTLLRFKLGIVGAYASLQIALVALWCLDFDAITKASVAEPVLGLIESLALAALSYLEHRNSRKPSVLIGGYLVLSVLLDLALTRTLWMRHGMDALAAVFTSSLVLKTILLVLEETPKRLINGEKGSIRETSVGVVNRSFFWWLNRLFFEGSRSILDMDSLGEINEKFNTHDLSEQLDKRWNKDPKTSAFALLKCTFLTYKWQFFAGIPPRLLHSGFNFAQPFLIQSIIIFVSTKQISLEVAGGLIGATVLVYLGLAISGAWHKHLSYQMVTMYRGGLTALIFKKTLKLRAGSIRESAPVTLMSTDIATIVAAGASVHDTWANLLELPVGIYLLYRQVGRSSLLVLVPTFLTTILSGIISPAMEPATVQWNAAVQKRVGETSSMLSQIKGIKMLGLAVFFHDLVQGLRVTELKVSAKMRWLLVHFVTLAMASAQITPIVVILSAIYWTKADGGLSVAEAFTSLSLVALVTQPLVSLTVSVMQVAGVLGGCGRIQAFLLLGEQEDSRSSLTRIPESRASSVQDLSPKDPDMQSSPQPEHKETGYSGTHRPAAVIEDATFETSDGVALLKKINLTVLQGTLNMFVGRVGCGKSSLLKAIVGELVPTQGSVSAETSLGYCDQIPWLRNISIQDNIIGQSPFDDKWFQTVLQSCALDDDIAQLPEGEKTIVGPGGVALSGGQKQRVALARAVYSQRQLLVLDDVFSSLDNSTSDKVFQRLMGPTGLLRRTNTTVILTTSHARFLPAADYVTTLDEGCITHNQVPYDEVKTTALGELQTDTQPEGQVMETGPLRENRSGPSAKQEIDLARQTGDRDCYKIYLRSMGWQIISVVFPVAVVGSVIEIVPHLEIWLRFWTEHGNGSKDAHYAGGYVGFALAGMLLSAFNFYYFLILAVPKSSNSLHRQLLNSVCRAPLHFFTSTESGGILNRFSQDMTLIDQSLPLAFFLTVDFQTGVVASGASYFGAFLPLSFLTLYLIQKYYLRTSRQMRFLDLEAKSPLYTHFTEITAGLSTVRSFGWSEAFLAESFHLLSESQRPFYLMFCIQRWLELALDLFVAGMAILLVTLALRIKGATTEGAIGLAMVNLLGFNQTLTVVIDQWTQLETSLGAIARLKSFLKNTPDENKSCEKETPQDWPSEGGIEIDSITASYGDETSPILNDVSLVIKRGQKVCICGRSGSGKSSLVLSILRLLELQAGAIRIDGRDLSTIPRQHIRSHITAIPQDPVTLSGTVRYNLDAEGHIQADELLIQALEKTTLWPTIESRGGLDADLNELGFSVGQRQLFCLARALLSHSKILLLDEPTSSVDNATDTEVRQTLKEFMDGRTVVEVAHRLDQVTDFDIAVIMGDGKIIETGDPEELLGRDSALKKLRHQGQ